MKTELFRWVADLISIEWNLFLFGSYPSTPLFDITLPPVQTWCCFSSFTGFFRLNWSF